MRRKLDLSICLLRSLKNGIRKYTTIKRKYRAIEDAVRLWQKESYDKSFVGFFFSKFCFLMMIKSVMLCIKLN